MKMLLIDVRGAVIPGLRYFEDADLSRVGPGSSEYLRHRRQGYCLLVCCFVCLFWVCGCHEPPYRYDVRSTGEGGVQVNTVPKETPPGVQAAPVSTAASSAAMPTATDQQQIDQLKARVRELSTENQKLRQHEPATAPSP